MFTFGRTCLLIAVLASVAQFGVTADKEKDSPEIGTWTGKNWEGEKTTAIFEKGGKFSIKVESFELKGMYKVDWSKKPGQLDLSFEKDGKKLIVETIIEIQKDGTLKFQDSNNKKTRPTKFDEKSFTLKKSESK